MLNTLIEALRTTDTEADALGVLRVHADGLRAVGSPRPLIDWLQGHSYPLAALVVRSLHAAADVEQACLWTGTVDDLPRTVGLHGLIAFIFQGAQRGLCVAGLGFEVRWRPASDAAQAPQWRLTQDTGAAVQFECPLSDAQLLVLLQHRT